MSALGDEECIIPPRVLSVQSSVVSGYVGMKHNIFFLQKSVLFHIRIDRQQKRHVSSSVTRIRRRLHQFRAVFEPYWVSCRQGTESEMSMCISIVFVIIVFN